jgi:hypothetical protein
MERRFQRAADQSLFHSQNPDISLGNRLWDACAKD